MNPISWPSRAISCIRLVDILHILRLHQDMKHGTTTVSWPWRQTRHGRCLELLRTLPTTVPTRHWLIKFPASPTSDDCGVLSQPRLIREAVTTGLKDKRGSYPARQERCQSLSPWDVSVQSVKNTILWRCFCIDLNRSLRRRDYSVLPIISKDRKGT